MKLYRDCNCVVSCIFFYNFKDRDITVLRPKLQFKTLSDSY